MKTIFLALACSLSMLSMCYGQKIGDTTYVTLQIVDENNMLVNMKVVTSFSVAGARESEFVIWVTAPTKGLVDRRIWYVEKEMLTNIGTKMYETANGPSTVEHFRLMTDAEAKAKKLVTEAEANAKKLKLEAQAKAEKWQKHWTLNKHIWKDKTGKFSVEAVYDSYLGDGKIQLRREDESELVVELIKLSENDRLKAVDLRKKDKSKQNK